MPERVRLSKGAIEGAKLPAKGRRDLYDSSTPGLAVTITANGRKSFYLIRKHEGRTLRLFLGAHPAITPEQARAKALETLGDLSAGIDVVARKKAIAAEATLGDVFELYMTKHARPKKRTADEDERRWNLHIAGWKARRISALTVPEVSAWHARVGNDHGPYAANRAHSLLRKVLNFARLEGYVGPNPAQGIPHLPETRRDRFVSIEEMPRLWRAIAALSEPDARDFFALLLLTAARRGNVLAMRWDAVDLVRGAWTIPAASFKTGRTVVLPLIAPALQILTRRKAEAAGSPWVFAGDGETGHRTEPKQAWARVLRWAEIFGLAEAIAVARKESIPDACAAASRAVYEARLDALARAGKDPLGQVTNKLRAQAEKLGIPIATAGLPGLRLHDLRRTGASFMAMAGVSLHTIGRVLGHEGTSATGIYARLSVDAQRAAMAQAGAVMLAAGGEAYAVPVAPEKEGDK